MLKAVKITLDEGIIQYSPKYQGAEEGHTCEKSVVPFLSGDRV
jgi:hypothetical protein